MPLLDMLVSARDTIKIDRDELTRRTRGDFGDKASALGFDRAAFRRTPQIRPLD